MSGSHLKGPLMVGGFTVAPSGDYNAIGMSRAFPEKDLDSDTTKRAKIYYVDSAVFTNHPEYKGGGGRSWRDACSTIQAAINKARYSTGTTINYSDDRDVYVLVAPGLYEERPAYSGKGIHLIGTGVPGSDSGVNIQLSGASTFGFAVTGTGLEISNIHIGVTESIMGFLSGPTESTIVQDCCIEDGQGTTQMTIGMYFGNGLKNSQVLRNTVANTVAATGIGIHLDTGGAGWHYASRLMHNDVYSTEGGATGILMDNSPGGMVVVKDNQVLNFTAAITGTNAGQFIVHNYTDVAPTGGTRRDNQHTNVGE